MAISFTFVLSVSLLCLYGVKAENQELITSFPYFIRSERDLPYCATANTVCSILQKRYWLPSILHRYCRCPEGVDCPDDWTGQSETSTNTTGLARKRLGTNFSMFLNNRAQMKFCSSVQSIDTCEPNQTAINVRMNVSLSEPSAETLFPSTRVICKCPPNHAWLKLDDTTMESVKTSSYTCKPLKRCRLKSNCGAITTDTFSIYPYCLCRKGNVCTVENRTVVQVQELHYSGPAYLGVCKPIF